MAKIARMPCGASVSARDSINEGVISSTSAPAFEKSSSSCFPLPDSWLEKKTLCGCHPLCKASSTRRTPSTANAWAWWRSCRRPNRLRICWIFGLWVEVIKASTVPRILPKIVSGCGLAGPRLEDFLEDLEGGFVDDGQADQGHV